MFHLKNVQLMKRKNRLFMPVAAAVLTALGLVSCSKTETIETAGEPTMRSVMFNIQLPAGDPVHYTRAIQDGNEYSFSSLHLLPYDAAEDVLLEPQDITADLTDNSWDGNNYQYLYTEATPAAAFPVRHFIFVGNDALTDANLDEGDAYADLSNALCAATIAANSAESTVFTDGYLPMTGEGTQVNGTKLVSLSTSLTTEVNVELVRCVARIDLINMTPNLVVTEVSLDNVNPNGYLMPGTVPSFTKVNGVLPFTALSGTGLPGIALADYNAAIATTATDAEKAVLTASTVNKAFYVYEDAENLTTDMLTLNVKGTVNGIGVYYRIPFAHKYAVSSGDDNSIAIERNHLYTVKLGDGTPIASTVAFTASIVKADWLSDETVTAELDAAIFTATVPMDASDNTQFATGYSYEMRTNKLIIPDAQLSGTDVTIKVNDSFYNSTTPADRVVITGVEVWDNDANGWTSPAVTSTGGTASGTWLSAAFTSQQTVTITTSSANTGTEARTGQVRIAYHYTDTNSQAHDKKIAFSVTQSAPTAP